MSNKTDDIVPDLSASLEYLKCLVNTVLATQPFEAQLDCFGKYMFDLKSKPAGKPETRHHQYEWKLA